MRDREGPAHTVELATPGVCLAQAFSEQLAAHGDVHGLLFGVISDYAPESDAPSSAPS
jgi:hypothetical protein